MSTMSVDEEEMRLMYNIFSSLFNPNSYLSGTIYLKTRTGDQQSPSSRLECTGG